MNQRQKLGRLGETFAAEVLTMEGYRILERNYTTRYGEIDLIAEYGDELVFVEVKTRRTPHYGEPCEAITQKKQQHLRRAASVYLEEQRVCYAACSFHVVEIKWNQIVDAF